jgi:hypothetical protein
MGHRRPEMAQTCGDWSAGVAASYALADLMRAITCEDRGRDRYGRSIGLCRADSQHLGAAMVSAAFTRYSSATSGRRRRRGERRWECTRLRLSASVGVAHAASLGRAFRSQRYEETLSVVASHGNMFAMAHQRHLRKAPITEALIDLRIAPHENPSLRSGWSEPAAQNPTVAAWDR